MTKKAKPLVLFTGLPIVFRKLRGSRPVSEVAAGAGLAILVWKRFFKRYRETVEGVKGGIQPAR